MTAATATELWQMSATELAEATRTRQASSAEVVKAVGAAGVGQVPADPLIVAPACTESPFDYRVDLCLDAAGAIEDWLGIITPIDPR